MDDKLIAAQLRQPSGELGKQVAEWMNEGNAALYQMVFEQMAMASGDYVLEIGFGNGKHLGEVAALVTEGFVAGIDFSDDMVREATQRNQQWIGRGNVEIKPGNVSAIPYPDHQFDKVYTLNTIYFWEHPSVAAREIYRVLKPGGTAYIGLRTAEKMKKLPFTQHGFTLYRETDVTNLLQQSGFANSGSAYRDDPQFDCLCVMGSRS